MRTYIVIALGILFLLCLWWTTRQEKTESNPQRPRMLGWFEAISGVTLVFTTSIMLCGELGVKPSDQPPEVLWLVPAIIAVGSLAIEWPVERKKRYEDLSKWIWGQLLTKGSVSIQEIIRRFVPTPEITIHTPVGETEKEKKEEEYKFLILWFYKQNEKMGVEIRNGQLVWRLPPAADVSSEYRKPL